MNTPSLAATVLVGFLGSGKTTLLNHVLTQQHGRRIAVIVNDFAELNIDSRLVRRTDERLIEMSNGCICCTLRADLLEELQRLATEADVDYVLIESTGIGEPLPIAQTFFMDDLPELVRLDSVVTVVDSARFWHDFERSDLIEDGAGNLEESSLAPLLVDQLEFTNIVLLNKADLAAPEELDRLEGFVRQLNPEARIQRTTFGQVALDTVFDTGLFDYEAALGAEDWVVEWSKDGSEAEEYGFHTFIYRTRDPLRWDPFVALFEDWPEQIIRAKGFVAFDDRPPVILSLSGGSVELESLLELDTNDDEPDGYGLDAAMPEDDGGYDDGLTEIVFIGRAMPIDEFRARIERCLATAQLPSGD